MDFIPPKAPTVTEPDINQAPAPSLSLPEPKAPSKQISIVQPNASPFTGFFFNANNNDINLKTTTDHTSLTVENFKDIDSKTLYAGIDPNSVKSDPKNAIPALKTGAYEGNNFSGSLITEHAKRPTNILYRSGSKLSNLTFFVRGYFGDGSDGYIDVGSGHSGGSDTLGEPTLGTIGVHTLLDTKVENVKAYLYGRVSKIREKSGEIKLEVKQNHYFSVKPEIGAELGFKHYFGMKALKTTLGVAYENELGRVANGKNKARVVDTAADWFNIRGEKEDRKGNVKFDLNVGLDNTRFGVTANVGYDTKGKNIRSGLGLRVIF
mgnify:CR=1 FL=1